MLQAINERGERIIPSNFSAKEIKLLRQQTFYCPICKEKVIIRAGPKVIPHFAHLATSTCVTVKTNETNYHKQAKIQLFNWLQLQQFPVQLEKYLRPIKQQTDIFVKYKRENYAIEFQNSQLVAEDFINRINGYKRLNINSLWLIGTKRLKQVALFTFRIPASFQSLINVPSVHDPSNIIFYCPYEKRFTILTDLYFVSTNLVFALPHYIPIQRATFHHLFLQTNFPQKKLLQLWLEKKKSFRLSVYPVYGQERQFRQWLYEKKLHVEQLPSIIHLPIRLQFKLNSPLWHWQSKLVINKLNPLRVGAVIHQDDCIKEIIPYVAEYDKTIAKAVIEQYFTYLEAGKWFVKVNQYEWRKLRSFRFYRYIEDALIGDQLFIQHLIREMCAKKMLYTHKC